MKHLTVGLIRRVCCVALMLALAAMLAPWAEAQVAVGTVRSDATTTEPTRYELESLEFSQNPVYTGNDVTVYWAFPDTLDSDYGDWDDMRLYAVRVDSDGNPVEGVDPIDCGETYFDGAMEDMTMEGSTYISFDQENAGDYIFYISAESYTYGMVELTSDEVLTVLAHEPAEAHVVWKNAAGEEITSATVGQPVTAEWRISNVQLNGAGGSIRITSTNGIGSFSANGTSGTATFTPTKTGTCELRLSGTGDDGFDIYVYAEEVLTVTPAVIADFEKEQTETGDRVTVTFTGLGNGSGRTVKSANWFVEYSQGDYSYLHTIQVEDEIIESWNSSSQPSFTYVRDFTWGNSASLFISYQEDGENRTSSYDSVALTGNPAPAIEGHILNMPDEINVSLQEPVLLNWEVTGAGRIIAISLDLEVADTFYDPTMTWNNYYTVDLDVEGLAPDENGKFSGTAEVKLPATTVDAYLYITAEKESFTEILSFYLYTTGEVAQAEDIWVDFDEPELPEGGTVEWKVYLNNQGIHLQEMDCYLIGPDNETKYTGTYREADGACVFTGVQSGAYRLKVSGQDKVNRYFNETSEEKTIYFMGTVPEVTRVFTETVTETGEYTVNLRDNLLKAYVKNDDPEGNTSGWFYYVSPNGTAEIPGVAKEYAMGPEGESVYSTCWNIEDVSAGEYEIHFILNYGNGETTENAEMVTVVRVFPAPIENLIATDDLTCVRLNWSMAAEIDTAGYAIFRRKVTETPGEFVQVDTALGRETCFWDDDYPSRGDTYEYYVVAISDVGEKGEPCAAVQVTHEGDMEPPVVTMINPGNQSRLSGTVTVSARAQDNLKVVSLALSYSQDGGENWAGFGLSSNGSLTCSLDTAWLEDGEVLIRGIAWDSSGNESAPMYRTWQIDTQGPGEVTGLTCVSTTSTVLTLKWDNVEDEDISHYTVQRMDGDGNWQQEATVYGTLGANIRGLIPDTEYSFRVAGVDLCGNIGAWSDAYTVSTAADTAAPVVTAMGPAAGAYAERVALTATVSDDYNVASITFQIRSGEEEEWQDLQTLSFADAEVSASRTARFTLELAEYDEGSVFIRPIAEDSAGNISDRTETAPLTEYIVDRTAPDAPAGVTATGRPGAVEIAWEQGTEADLGAYTVYRADTEDGEFEAVASGLTSLNWFDRRAERDTQYAYRVRVSDRAGNLSDFSQTVSGMVEPDVEAPIIQNIYPEGGDTLGPNERTLQVLATDNNELDSILVEYSTDNGNTYAQAGQVTGIGEKGRWMSCTLPITEWIDGGVVRVRAEATDMTGNVSTPLIYSYYVDATAPVIEEATAEYSEAEDCVLITWQGGHESDLAGYVIYRVRDEEGNPSRVGTRAANEDCRISDSRPVSVDGEYIYRIEALDEHGNSFTVTVSCPAPEEEEENPEAGETGPTAVLSCDTAMEAGVQYRFDASGSTGSVTAWHFDFGDGTESTERMAVHAFTETGTYTVTLTVTDGEGRQDSASRQVTVSERTMLGTLTVRVVDEKNARVPGASVYLNLGDPNQTVKTTDGNGEVSFTTMAGGHVIGAIIPNNEWLPAQTRVVVTAGQTAEATLTLVHQPMIEGSFETRQMTFDEIVAAGIDATDPANRNYVQIDLHLTYQSDDYEETVPVNLSNWPHFDPIVIDILPDWDNNDDDDDPDDDDDNNDDGEGRELIVIPFPIPDTHGIGNWSNYQFSGEDISLAILDVPVGISALKDFFEVKLYIINNASSEFSMLDNVISLDVPSGLSLMETYRSEKSSTVRRAEIKGQTTESIMWILRGDAVGEYLLSADYTGRLAKFNEEISTRFVAEKPIEVKGLSNASVTIEIADQLDKDRLYYNVLLENKGSSDLYCPDIETEDDLIRMDLFDAEHANWAKDIRYSANLLEKLSSSIAPTIDPNVFEPGALLIKHYVTYGGVQYTEKKLELEEYGYSLSEDIGMEVTIIEQPLTYFTSYLGTGRDPATMSQSDLEELTDDDNYAYWNIYNLRDPNAKAALKSKGKEFLWDLASFVSGNGSIKELFDLDSNKTIEALIVDAMCISVEDSDDIGVADTILKWLKGIKEFVEVTHFDKAFEEALRPQYTEDTEFEVVGINIDIFEWTIETFTLIEEDYSGAFVDFVENGDGDYGSFFSYYSTKTSYYEENIELITRAKIDENTRKRFFGGILTDERFKEVWEGIGFGLELAEMLVDVAKNVQFDYGVALAAQSNEQACKLFLDTLINANTSFKEQGKIRSAAEEVKERIEQNDLAQIVLKDFIEGAVYTGVEAAGKDGVEYIKKAASANVIAAGVLTALNIGTTIGDKVFHVNDVHDLADNIRYLSVMSYDFSKAIRNGTHSGEDAVRMVGYLCELRRMGESQVAQLGMKQEIIRYLSDSEEMFLTVRDATIPASEHGEIYTWQLWRNYVEDRISALMVRLMRRPTYPYGVDLKAPVVTINYPACQTAQSFGADYKWRVSGQEGWTACTGEPIPVVPGEEPYVLMVRNAQASGEERLTAAVLVETAPDLAGMGIEISAAEDGYLLEFPDNDLTYSYTLSGEMLELEFRDELAVQIPEGSYSQEIAADAADKYLYLRSAATPERFASNIWQISLARVKMKAFVFSDPVDGTVELIGYNGEAENLEIPKTVPQNDGSESRVTGIGAEALKEHTGLKTVWIPEGVLTIGDSAFEGCTALRYAALPESVVTVGSAAFKDCAALGWASLPAGIATVGNNVFTGCAGSFTAIVVSGSPAESTLRAAGVSYAVPVTLPEALTEIEESAFEGAGFAAVTVPAGCASIGQTAYAGCSQLRVVYLETETALIAGDAFPDQEMVFYAPAGSDVFSRLEAAGYRVYSHH